LLHMCELHSQKWLSSLLLTHPTWSGGIFCTFRWVIVSILLTNTRVSCVGGNLVAVGAFSMCQYTVEKNFGGIPSPFSSVAADEPTAKSICFRAANASTRRGNECSRSSSARFGRADVIDSTWRSLSFLRGN